MHKIQQVLYSQGFRSGNVGFVLVSLVGLKQVQLSVVVYKLVFPVKKEETQIKHVFRRQVHKLALEQDLLNCVVLIVRLNACQLEHTSARRCSASKTALCRFASSD